MIRSFIKGRIHNWILSSSKTITTIYILPSKQGSLYLATNFLIFLVGLTYANNIVLLISFILVSFLIIIMIRSHFYLDAIKIENINISSGYEDIGAACTVNYNSKNPNPSFSIWSEKSSLLLYKNQNNNYLIKGCIKGFYQGSYYKITSDGPLGLFTTWRYKKQNYSFYTYPLRYKDSQTLKIIEAQTNEESDSEYKEHLPFEKGMPLTRVDWKRFSKSEELLVKTFSSSYPICINIDYDLLEGDHNRRIEKISWLISYSFEREYSWNLKAPGIIAMDQEGFSDYHRCNEVLSLL